MTPEQLEARLKQGNSPVLLDVRSHLEFQAGHIPSALHAPLPELLKAAQDAAKDKQSLLVLVCEHGPRAQVAKLFLKLRGYKDLQLLDGHMSRWRREGRPLQVG